MLLPDYGTNEQVVLDSRNLGHSQPGRDVMLGCMMGKLVGQGCIRARDSACTMVFERC